MKPATKKALAAMINHVTDNLGNMPGGLIGEILAERLRQDSKWGGPKHDDHHTPEDWESFIAARLSEPGPCIEPFRHRMVEIAALALAAIESYDRKSK